MELSQIKHKEIQFHKANFKNAKKVCKILSSKQIIHLTEHNFNEPKNEMEKNIKSSSLANVFRNVEEKFLINSSKNLIRPHKLESSNKIRKKMNLLLRQKTFKKIVEEKNEELSETNKNQNTSKNKYKRCKSMYIKNSSKDLNSQENNYNLICDNSDNKIKIKKENEVKFNEIKINKNDKKNNDDTEEKSGDVVNNIKKKFFCCL